MTYAELVREASAIVPPVGATLAIALVDDQLHFRAAFLIGGRRRSDPVGPSFDKPRAACAFVDLLNGNEPSTSRSSLDSDLAARSGDAASSRDEGGATSEAPGSTIHPAPPGSVSPGASLTDPAVADPVAAGVRTCDGCHKPLPAGSRPNRRTHGPACRLAAHRQRHAADAPVAVSSDVPRGDVTVSRRQRPSDAASPAEVLAAHKADVIRACNPEVPTARADERGRLLRSSARDAGPELDPTGQRPAVPSFGH